MLHYHLTSSSTPLRPLARFAFVPSLFRPFNPESAPHHGRKTCTISLWRRYYSSTIALPCTHLQVHLHVKTCVTTHLTFHIAVQVASLIYFQNFFFFFLEYIVFSALLVLVQHIFTLTWSGFIEKHHCFTHHCVQSRITTPTRR